MIGLVRPRSNAGNIGNLPNARSPLVGRAFEFAHALDLLRQKRCVEFVGPGGIGKSRLALECAFGLRETQHEGVWWLNVTAASTAGDLAAAVCKMLGFGEVAPAIESAIAMFADQSVGLVLDACEHAPRAASEFANAVLARCPQAVIVLTTRVPTGVAGGAETSVRALPESSARQLFAQRAAEADPNFSADDRSGANLAEVCEMLAGVPLAIELACAYLQHGDLWELRDRLRRHAGEIASALDTTLAWRFDVLEPSDATFFRRLGIFDRDFDLAGAEAVDEGNATRAALDRLEAASLVVCQRTAGRTSYRLLDPVRAFVRTHLTAEEAAAARSRFVTAAAERAADYAKRLRRADEMAMELVRKHGGSFVTALEFAAGEPTLIPFGLRIAAFVGVVLGTVGHATAALAAIERIVLQGSPADSAFERAMETYSWMLMRTGQYERAIAANADRVARARASHDPHLLANALATSIVALRMSRDIKGATALGEEAITVARTCGAREPLARALRGLAACYAFNGRVLDAIPMCEELCTFEESEVGALEYTIALHDYGAALRDAGRDAEAAVLLERAVRRSAAMRDFNSAMQSQVVLARLHLDRGEVGKAFALLREALAFSTPETHPLTRTYAFEDLVAASLRDGQFEKLAHVLGFLDRMRERVNFRPIPEHAEYIAQVRSAVENRVGADAYRASYTRGRLSTLDETMALIDTLEPGTLTVARCDRFAVLSAREREVAELMQAGKTNRQIADALVVSVRTVDHHVASIFRKLEISRREDL